MQAPPRPAGQGQIVCGNCRILLMFPQGAQNVRCARCSHITPVPPPVNPDTMAQLHCTSCRTLLMYPRGAMQVQCSMCGTLNDAQQANQLGHVNCNGCQITLMYSYGSNVRSVKCALCNHVTPVGNRPGAPPPPPPYQQPHHHHHPHHTPAMRPPPHASGGGQPDSKPPMQAVLVENPPSLDESGNEVQNVSLGVVRPKAEPAT